MLRAVGTRTIAARAGVSAATLFHHYGTTESLARAVLDRVYDPARPSSSDREIGPGVTEIRGSALPTATALEFHAGEFDRITSDAEHPLRIGLWALGGEAGRAAYGDYLRQRDAPLHDFAHRLYDSWGRELRPPLSMAAFGATHAALLNGTAIRASVDTALDREVFARSAASLSLVMLRMKGERRDLDDRLAEINYFPLPDRGSRHQGSTRAQPRRDAVVASARTTFWERGYADATMAEIARTADVATSTLHALFNGKADLAVHCLLAEARAHLDPRPTPWRERLDDVVGLLARCAHLTEPYAAELVAGGRERPDDTVLEEVRSALRDGVATGELADDVDLDDLAHTVLTVVLARLLSRPADGAGGASTWLRRTVLAGVQLPG
nr:helix-turn-helix domain containing protein [Nocardioides flavescens]